MLVDNRELRRTVEESGISLYEICDRLEWTPVKSEASRLARRLGKIPYHSRGKIYIAKRVHLETVYRIKETLHDTPYQRALDAIY